MLDTPVPNRSDHEQRIREFAYHLWEQAGRPYGRDVEFWERARELVAIEENPAAGLLPNPMTHPTMATGQPEGVEEAEIQANYGEFPGRLTDQGDRQETPQPRQNKRGPRKAPGKPVGSRAKPANGR